MRRFFYRIVITLLAFSASLLPPPASAAVTLAARLVDFTPWLSPEGTLRAVIEVTNSGSDTATRLAVGLQIHEGVDTRSQLERSFEGSLGSVVSSDTIPVATEVGAGATETITIEKPLPEIRFFSGGPDDRAYPVRLIVRSGKVSAPPVDTQMIFFNRPAPVPLGVALVIPLHAPTPFDPAMDVSSDAALESVTGGNLRVVLDSLSEQPEASLALAPSGLLLDDLTNIADGYSTEEGDEIGRDSAKASSATRMLEQIRGLALRPAIQIVSAPYAQANLAWLSKGGRIESAQAQVAEGGSRIRQFVTESPSTWLLPAMGAIDGPILSALQPSGISGVIINSSSIPRRRISLTPATPIELRGLGEDSITALVSDPGLDARLSAPVDISPVVARQRFLAETATIMLERPAEQRVVAAVAPATWGPARSFIDPVLLALAQSPWMRGVTPDVAVAQIETRSRSALLPADSILGAGVDPPPQAYEQALGEARIAIDRYSDLGPPETRLNSLERTILVAEGSDWWGSRRLLNRGDDFAAAVQESVKGEFEKIKGPAAQTITLTSRTGIIPLVVSTQTDYPVQVVITLDSDKLDFPEGTEIRSLLVPPAQTIRVPAVAEASGTFPVRVVVSTPNRSVELASTRLVVRSTAYNVVGVAITIGAGVFMLFGWVGGILRRRVTH